MNTIHGTVLEGIRVVDLSRVLAGPHCARLLADFGADVVKVEAPEGDENRSWPPYGPDGQSANFASVNRGKRGLVLDLKNPAAADILRRLARDADVLIHSFLPDTSARLGISDVRLRADNPRLIVATISGYGAEGPLADKRGYDLMVQAFSGAMSATGVPGGPPIRCGVSFIDMSTGIALYAGIVTAWLARATTGQGNVARVHRRDELIPMLEDRSGCKPVAWWVGRFEARSVAFSPLHTVDQVMTHPQVIANAMRVTARDAGGVDRDLVGTPFKLADGAGIAPFSAPALGAGTAAILADRLGLTGREIDGLRQAGAFG